MSNQIDIDAFHALADVAGEKIDSLEREVETLRADLEALAVPAWELFGWVVTRSTDMPIRRLQKQIEPLATALVRPRIQKIVNPEGSGG